MKAIAVSGVAALTAAGASAQAADDGLEAAFRAAFSTPADRPGEIGAARLAFLHDAALVIDSDVPFPLQRADYADHLGFHAAHWERLEMQLLELKTVVHGDTGLVSAYFNQRGKPRDAGFRQRPGYVTAVCARSADGWKAIGLHMSPMMAQIIDASPG
jgi:ketosteroid isomerase-like protein